MRQHNPKAILVFASTNKVYGGLDEFNLIELETRYSPEGLQAVPETQQLDFHSPYGASKGAADQYVRDYARSFGLQTIVFRQSCIYGEHQLGVVDQGWLAHFALSAIKQKEICIYGDGKQVRDILYIGDLVEAYVAAVNEIETTSGKIYNIGGGLENTVSLQETLTYLQNNVSPMTISYTDERIGDQKYYVSDVSKAKADFNWEPKTNFEQGMTKLVTWLQEQK